MEIKNVRDLQQNLGLILLGMGINPEFKDLPAYESAVSKIKSIISQINMTEETINNTRVDINDGVISFNHSSKVSTHEIKIFIDPTNPNTFGCLSIKDKDEYVDTNLERQIKSRTCVQTVVELGENGFIDISDYGSIIKNTYKDINKCDNSTWLSVKRYDSNGIVNETETTRFIPGPLAEPFDNAHIDSMLYIPRLAATKGSVSDNYTYSERLVRKYPDVARLVVDDPENERAYASDVSLDSEHGLKDMHCSINYENPVVIPSISKQQIEAIIMKEEDPRISKGLTNYISGREKYFYNSDKDPHFRCKNDDQKRQGM